MSPGTTTALLIFVVIILIISLVYISMASEAIDKVSIGKDAGLTQAKSYLLYASIIGWLIAIVLVLGSLYLFSEEKYAGHESTIMTGVIVFAMVLVFIMGVLAAVSASHIGGSSLYKKTTAGNTEIEKAYRYSVIAAVAALGTFIFIVIAFMGYRHYKSEKLVTEHFYNAPPPIPNFGSPLIQQRPAYNVPVMGQNLPYGGIPPSVQQRPVYNVPVAGQNLPYVQQRPVYNVPVAGQNLPYGGMPPSVQQRPVYNVPVAGQNLPYVQQRPVQNYPTSRTGYIPSSYVAAAPVQQPISNVSPQNIRPVHTVTEGKPSKIITRGIPVVVGKEAK